MIYHAFFDFFKEYSDCYTVIGGNAASILMEERGLNFRATVDYDLVILFENISSGFSRHFMEFIKKFDYSMNGFGKRNHKDYYRFVTKNPMVPKQIELFCRKPFLYALSVPDSNTAPLHFEDGPSLSAIVLDDDYYEVLKKGTDKVTVDSETIPILSTAYLILFKAKAHLDIKMRMSKGEHISHRADKSKHFNDVCRLVTLIPDSHYDVDSIPLSVQEDLKEFIKIIKDMDKNEFNIRFGKVSQEIRPDQNNVINRLNDLIL